MKVRELIEKLQTCDPELEVEIEDAEYGDWVVEKVIEESVARRYNHPRVILNPY